jgi:hypothetical protein
MLDLNSRIDLDEEKLTGIDVDQKLYRAGRSILHRAAQTDGRLADALPELLRQVRARRNFDNLLMTTLYRAVAFPEMDELAVRVTENLHFDVLRPRDVALEKDLGLAKGSRGLSHRLRNLLGQFARGCDDPDAATAAAKAGLMMGKPNCPTAQISLMMAASVPGTVSTPTGAPAPRGLVAEGLGWPEVGPTKQMPASSQARASRAFSDKPCG